jgi:hypothetical protein
MAAVSRHSFNIGPYGKNVEFVFPLKPVSQFKANHQVLYSYVKTKSSHGGHLEFPIGKRFTSLVQDHPMIIPAKSQFNWLGGFSQEDFLNFSQ